MPGRDEPCLGVVLGRVADRVWSFLPEGTIKQGMKVEDGVEGR